MDTKNPKHFYGWPPAWCQSSLRLLLLIIEQGFDIEMIVKFSLKELKVEAAED